LLKQLRQYSDLAIAFSGGTDSTLLLKAAKEAPVKKLLAVTVSSESTTAKEIEFARQFCLDEDIAFQMIEVEQLKISGFSDNPPDRCYICKKSIFLAIMQTADEHGINNIAEGTNADDSYDYRPGAKAIAELGIASPLKDAGLTKAEIREISKALELPTWDKPATPCLATRIPTGETITLKKLRMIEQSEQLLADLGFRQMRVRMHGDDLARIEVMPGDFNKLLDLSDKVAKKLKEIGFRYVSMDLGGYSMGNMNKIED
jgi:uncharacterized protein